jgi:FKBP-type peptidyl-prolyl cis-trans isomerase FkpA
MKKLCYGLVVLGLICFFSCGKTVPDNPACTDTPPSADSAALIKFAGDSIKLTWDSSGVFYHIIDSGSATNKPVYSSQITVDYIGRLMNNVIFDSASNTNLLGNPVDQLLLGWRVGILKIGVGGHIQLFIPSALGYGCTGYGPVPPNMPLFYDVKLLGVD